MKKVELFRRIYISGSRHIETYLRSDANAAESTGGEWIFFKISIDSWRIRIMKLGKIDFSAKHRVRQERRV